MTSKYALQALVHIALRGDEGPVMTREIATQLGLPMNYLSKILHQLGREGLLEATRGKSGGYTLSRPPSKIRVADVVRRFDDVTAFRNCFLGRGRCSKRKPCSAHDRWKPLADELLQFIEQTTLEDLAG